MGNKRLKQLVVALLVLNFIFIGLFLFGKMKHGKHMEPKYYIIEQLDFNASQITAYESLIEVHQQAMHGARDRIEKNRQALYQSLQQENGIVDSTILSSIVEDQMALNLIHYHHFEDIKELCTKDQIPAFNALVEELSGLFGKKIPPKGKKH